MTVAARGITGATWHNTLVAGQITGAARRSPIVPARTTSV